LDQLFIYLPNQTHGFIGAQRKIEFNYILRTKSSLTEGEDRPNLPIDRVDQHCQ